MQPQLLDRVLKAAARMTECLGFFFGDLVLNGIHEMLAHARQYLTRAR